MRWTSDRPGVYGSDRGQIVFRIGVRTDVEDPKGKFWAGVYQDGTHVSAADLGLPYEGIHRFKTLQEAQWYLEVNDREVA